MNEFKYICPNCSAALELVKTKYICPKCSAEWGMVEGVARLSRSPSYWSLVPEAEMKAFLGEVRSRGWKDAVLSSANPKIKELYTWTDAPSRADGTFYLSLTPQSSVLDLGSGWGSYTFGLSPRVKQVIAADSSLGSLEFISLRAQQDKRGNVAAVHIEPLDYARLPFPDSAFDAVIMNGVLEWVGSYLKKGDPLKIQRNCLKEVSRVLKPGGEVLIGIENRFGLRYILGAPDDHLKYYSSSRSVSYTTLLPRMIADRICRRTLGVSYRTYTHSLWGYRRMLKGAGFKKIDFYFPEQDYRAISSKIYPLNSNEVRKTLRLRTGSSRWLKLMSLFNLEPALCDSYFIRAGVAE